MNIPQQPLPHVYSAAGDASQPGLRRRSVSRNDETGPFETFEYGNPSMPSPGISSGYEQYSELQQQQQQPHKSRSYQFRALVRKTASYQKRQMFTNVCCIALCPFMMVAISALIGFVVNLIIRSANPGDEFLMCSNVPAMDAFNQPLYSSNSTSILPSSPSSQIPNAPSGVSSIKHINYYGFPISFSTAFSSAASLGKSPSCSWWMEKGYPYSEPYERDPGVRRLLRKDTTFKPDVKGGWYNDTYLESNMMTLARLQTLPWALVADADGVSTGQRSRPPSIPSSEVFNLIYGSHGSGGGKGGDDDDDDALIKPSTSTRAIHIGRSTKVKRADNNTSSNNTSSGVINRKFSPVTGGLELFNVSAGDGLFSHITYAMYANVTANHTSNSKYPFSMDNFQAVPFFPKISGSEKELDDAVAGQIRLVLDQLTRVNRSVVFKDEPDSTSLLQYYADISGIIVNMPWGALRFTHSNSTQRQWNYTLQVGTDRHISQSGSFPDKGLRRVVLQSMLSNAFLRQAAGTDDIAIVHGFHAMPELYSTTITIKFSAIAGTLLYPFGISFLFPIFVITLVREKEERIVVMMQMNGLRRSTYYLAHYIHFYLLHIVACIVFIISGLIFSMDLFTRNNPLIYILGLFLWGHVQIAMAMCLSTVFNKSRTALIMSFLLVLGSVIIDNAAETIYMFETPLAYAIWPPFAFYRSLAAMAFQSVRSNGIPYTWSRLSIHDPVAVSFIAMTAQTIVIWILTLYLQAVVPSEYGVSRPWHFPVTDLYKYIKNRSRTNKSLSVTDSFGVAADDIDGGSGGAEESELVDEDDDVRLERYRVMTSELSPQDYPLILRRVRKIYSNGKVAVRDVTFAVEKNMIFGLLGPNGAGKTSLINILTGVYQPTSGRAFVNGYDISTQMSSVYRSIGVCPQHDILWDDLTVEEHLLFYARLKGVDATDEAETVDKMLAHVALQNFRHRLSKGLSGGEKRRLSIAMALLGNPSVVFLDEMTTGTDPEVRRTVWNIINASKADRTIILTSHSMEEIEVLCNRIAIMAKGTLRCIGQQQHLKRLYGRGFKLQFSVRNPLTRASAIKFVESLLPPDAVKLDDFETAVSYEFSPESPNGRKGGKGGKGGIISNLFCELEKHKDEFGIQDWGLMQTTMDEVFMKIITEEDAMAEAV